MARRPAEGISQLPLDREVAKPPLSYLCNNRMAFWVDGALRERCNVCSLLGSASRREEGHISSSQVYLVGKRKTSCFMSIQLYLLCFLPPASANPSYLHGLIPQRLYILSYFN